MPQQTPRHPQCVQRTARDKTVAPAEDASIKERVVRNCRDLIWIHSLKEAPELGFSEHLHGAIVHSHRTDDHLETLVENVLGDRERVLSLKRKALSVESFKI